MAEVRGIAYDNGSPAAGVVNSGVLEQGAGKLGADTATPPSFGHRVGEYFSRLRQVSDHFTTFLANVIEIVIVVALVLVVLDETYFNNDTFGAEWLKDYGALFVAALGATAVGRLVAGVVSRSVISESA